MAEELVWIREAEVGEPLPREVSLQEEGRVLPRASEDVC